VPKQSQEQWIHLSLRADRSNLEDAEGLVKRRCNDNRGTAKKRYGILAARGSGGVPQLKKVPKDWGTRGLI
jgi:hypothetical protein